MCVVQVCARVGRQVGVASGRDEHRGHGRGGDGERDGESVEKGEVNLLSVFVLVMA